MSNLEAKRLPYEKGDWLRFGPIHGRPHIRAKGHSPSLEIENRAYCWTKLQNISRLGRDDLR